MNTVSPEIQTIRYGKKIGFESLAFFVLLIFNFIMAGILIWLHSGTNFYF